MKASLDPITNSILETNLNALRRSRPGLYQQLSVQKRTMVGELHGAPDGNFNLRYTRSPHQARDLWAYPPGGPSVEMDRCLSRIDEDQEVLVVFIGFGLGYEALSILENRPSVCHIVIIEPSLDHFFSALHVCDFSNLFDSPKVDVFLGPVDVQGVSEVVRDDLVIKDAKIFRHLPSLDWQPELYKMADQTVFSLLNDYNVAGATMLKAGPVYFRNRFDNLSQLRHMHSLEALTGVFEDRPAVLVAAGPSLDEDIHRLRDIRKKCVLICVDSALSVLLEEGIMPDFVTSLDFQLLNFEKVAPFAGRELPVSLLVIPKACPLVVKRLKPHRVILGFNEDAAHSWLTDLYGITRLLPNASSVAHLSLGLALIMGCNPIVFLGQDLAFTSQESDHAKGTIIHWPGVTSPRENDLWVHGVRDTKVITSRGFLPIKGLLEEIISRHKRRFINASARGARILGTEEMRFEEVCSRFLSEELDVEGEVLRAFQSHRGFDVEKLLREAEEIRQEIRQAASLINSFDELASGIERDVGPKGGASGDAFQRRVADLSVLNERINGFTRLWDMVADLTFRMQVENGLEQRKNKVLLKEKGYEPWLKAEVKRLRRSQAVRKDALEELDARLRGLMEHLSLEEEYSKGKDKARSKIALVRLYVESGDFVRARDVLAGFGQEELARDELMVLLGAVNAALLEEVEEIQGPWRKAIEASPENAEHVAELAQGLAEPWLSLLKEFPKIAGLASKWFSRLGLLLEFAPSLEVEIRKLWGQGFHEIENMLASDEFEQALAELEKWTPVEEALPPGYWYLKARALYGKGQIVEASSLADKALASGEEDAGRLQFFSRLLLERGVFEKGIQLLEQAVSIDPNAATLWEEIGDVLVDQGDFQGAVYAYERCVHALPHRIESLKKLGMAYRRTGNLEAAKAVLEMAVRRARGLPQS